jgi:hypothetical protein
MSKRPRQRPRPGARPQLPASRSNEPRNPPSEPERLLLDQIAAGELDPHLTAIADAIHARRELLHTINSAKALAMLNVGDRVRTTTPAPATCRASRAPSSSSTSPATVCLHRPVRRFTSGEIRCPLASRQAQPSRLTEGEPSRCEPRDQADPKLDHPDRRDHRRRLQRSMDPLAAPAESKIALRRAEARRKMPAQVPSLWASRAVRPAARRGHRAGVSVLFSSVPGGPRQGRMDLMTRKTRLQTTCCVAGRWARYVSTGPEGSERGRGTRLYRRLTLAWRELPHDRSRRLHSTLHVRRC